MGFLREFFAPNPWSSYDPDHRFRNEVIGIIGVWEFTKLEQMMKEEGLFDHDFFTTGQFSTCPDSEKLKLFISFINGWWGYLSSKGDSRNASFLLDLRRKLELAEVTKRVPKSPKQETIRAQALNAKGEVAGRIEKQPEDKGYTLLAGENADFLTLIMSTNAIFAEDISDEQKRVFSRWAGLPISGWGSQHRELFSLALTHYLQGARADSTAYPPGIVGLAKQMPSAGLPPLPNKLTLEVKSIFSGMLGFCAACGTELDRTNKFCSDCGHKTTWPFKEPRP